jgi:hypothetical protein
MEDLVPVGITNQDESPAQQIVQQVFAALFVGDL